jgi:hypothetical protein
MRGGLPEAAAWQTVAFESSRPVSGEPRLRDAPLRPMATFDVVTHTTFAAGDDHDTCPSASERREAAPRQTTSERIKRTLDAVRRAIPVR